MFWKKILTDIGSEFVKSLIPVDKIIKSSKKVIRKSAMIEYNINHPFGNIPQIYFRMLMLKKAGMLDITTFSSISLRDSSGKGALGVKDLTTNKNQIPKVFQVKYDGMRILCNLKVVEDEDPTRTLENTSSPFLTYYCFNIRTLKGNEEKLNEFLDWCDVEADKLNRKDRILFCNGIHRYYSPIVRMITNVTLDNKNLVYSDEVKEKVIDSIQNMYDNKELYEKFNKPVKKTFLVVGPPGTGKTSLKFYIAKHFYKDYTVSVFNAKSNEYIYLMDIMGKKDDTVDYSSKKGTINIRCFDDFERNISKTIGGSIVIKSGDKEIPLSDILMYFDNIRDNDITVITVNSIDDIPKALLRKGRIDDIIYLGYPDKANVENYLSTILEEKITLKTYEPKYSMAQIEGFIFDNYGNTPYIVDKLERGDIKSTKDVFFEVENRLKEDNPNNV